LESGGKCATNYVVVEVNVLIGEENNARSLGRRIVISRPFTPKAFTNSGVSHGFIVS
jgi:hypothetical protein